MSAVGYVSPLRHCAHIFVLSSLLAAGMLSILLWLALGGGGGIGAGARRAPDTLGDSKRLQCSIFTPLEESKAEPLADVCPEQNDTLASNLSADPSTVDALKDVKAPSSQPQIATFEEWTKERLLLKQAPAKATNGNGHAHVHESAPNGQAAPAPSKDAPPLKEALSSGAEIEGAEGHRAPDTPPQQQPEGGKLESPKRNYASRECGAKVLFANEEAENKGAVLNDKERDDYMRNPCERAQRKFLVVELCENIQVTSVELANFELFSSSPRHIRLLASERYPTLEWSVLAELEAENTRDVQSFAIRHAHGSYAKFIRLELLSHHGHEHYCTLSSLHVYGTSMVDEYEAEAAVVEAAEYVVPVLVEPVTAEPVAVQPTEDNSSVSANATEVLKTVVDTLKGALESTLQSLPLLAAKSPNTSGEVYTHARCTQCPLQPVARSRRRCHALCHLTHGDAPAAGAPRRRRTAAPGRAVTRAQRAFLRRVTAATVAKKAPRPPAPQPQPVEIPAAPPSPTPPPPPFSQHHGPLPGTSTNHKESVFLKLNKRLSALELNMSLSSEYLSELSRRYVAQSDELARQHERLLREAKEAAEQSAAGALHAMGEQLRALKEELRELRDKIAQERAAPVVVAELPSASPICAPAAPGSLSIPQPDDGRVCVGEQLLESLIGGRLAAAEEMWTTRQLAAAVVLAQLAAILVTLALQWALRRAVPSAADHPPRRHYLSVEEIRRLVREELAVGQLRRDEAIEERRRAADARSEPEDEITRGAARADGCPPLLDGLHAPLRPDGLKAESPPWQVVNKAAKNGRRHHKGAKQLHGQASS